MQGPVLLFATASCNQRLVSIVELLSCSHPSIRRNIIVIDE